MFDQRPQVVRLNSVAFQQVAGYYGRIYVGLQVGHSVVECHLKALDESRVLGDVIGRHTDAPCDLTENHS